MNTNKRENYSMFSPRWRKAFRDLWVSKTRTLLVVLSIAIGIVGIGSILNTYSILTREMDRNYMETMPASAILYTDEIDEATLLSIQARPEVAEAEARRTVLARYQLGENEWVSIYLFVIENFEDLRVNTFYPERGGWTPAADEILIERAGLSLIKQELGDVAVIKTPGNAPQNMVISGIVHDPGQAPAWMEGFAYGYITVDGLARLGEAPQMDELRVLASENGMDHGSNRLLAKELRLWLESNGRPVYRVAVPIPGEHPHNDQMATLLFILESFGILALLLSGLLVATMISALIEQQIRQIGVMKTVGARRNQIAGVYLVTVVILGAMALLIGIPLATLAGRAYADFAAAMLNFEIADYQVAAWVYGVQIVAALLIPIAGAAIPVFKGSRITVSEAISESGVSENAIGTRPIDALLGRVQGVGRTLLLSLRNTFRRQGRLALALIPLAFGGAVFMVALNVGASWNRTIDTEFDSRRYDASFRLAQPYASEELATLLAEAPGVVAVETWSEASSSLIYPNGDSGNPFSMIGLPPETAMLDLQMMEGRWLRPDEKNALVVTHSLLDHEPLMAVGSEVDIELNGESTTWTVVGVARLVGPNTAYANQEPLAPLAGMDGQSNRVMVATGDRSATGQAEDLQTMEAALLAAGVDVVAANTSQGFRQVLVDHLVIVVTLLLIMAGLVSAVSGLGLASTMSLNVLERRREIGVMRAVGAKTLKVLQIILVEGLFIGLLSWALALLISLPLTNLIGNVTGNLFIEAPLDIAYSPAGVGIWLAIVLVLTALASALPAVSATEIPVHEVLAYE